MSKTILVVGGAGYIGSHMVNTLIERGYTPIVFDSLVTGYRDAVSSNCSFIEGDLADSHQIELAFQRYTFDAVMHFASFIQVGESTKDPQKYYINNVSNTLNLLQVMLKRRVKYFIFSSSAAVYGTPLYTPIDEKHPQLPINPYGRTKSMIESVLKDYDEAYQLRSVSLRYFNAAGAHPDGVLGERHNPETHLIPLVLQVAAGKRKVIDVYGNDYPTPDGTCVRDYIHVNDLCEAHLLALEFLWQNNRSEFFNLGNGHGYSVREVIEVAGKVTGKSITVNQAPRREGDPAVLVASSAKAMQQLNWQPRYASLETIVEHAWQWERSRSIVL
ncbi:MAG: UDP-glucose 4-epimerase GalE [Gammaproteobacteria bacterium GWF2_41_13]|nr:MAG: UDP-glucose 4-epimerase GalE [Gammaproteobacteria bacterium GWF2_41_13]